MSVLSEALARVKFTATSPNGSIKLHMTMRGMTGIAFEPDMRRTYTPYVFERQLEMLLRSTVSAHQRAYRTVVDRVREGLELPARQWAQDDSRTRLQQEIADIEASGESLRRKVKVERERTGHFHVAVDPTFYMRTTDREFEDEVTSGLEDLYADHRNQSLRAWRRELPESITYTPLTRVGDE